jgi:serine/threonine protein kinase
MHPDDRVGHFEVLATIGQGGMGEVWKALDLRLQRAVALKTLSPQVARDPERIARLEREATLLAAVSHPNIAAIHGIEEHEHERFLVLELVEGPTLADRLLRGSLGPKQALEIALQIARAIEAAHERSVIHRDLKPANIKLARDGHVKVLDFGIAKDLGRLPPAPVRRRCCVPRSAPSWARSRT